MSSDSVLSYRAICVFSIKVLLSCSNARTHYLVRSKGWTDETNRRLCGNDLETPVRWCKDCPFAEEVWENLKQWLQLTVIQTANTAGSLHSFWWRCRRKFDKERRNVDGIFIYFWWNIWKERYRRQFQRKSLNPTQVAILCKDDISQHRLAMAQGQLLLKLKIFRVAVFQFSAFLSWPCCVPVFSRFPFVLCFSRLALGCGLVVAFFFDKLW
jgi:hypothetical protein